MILFVSPNENLLFIRQAGSGIGAVINIEIVYKNAVLATVDYQTALLFSSQIQSYVSTAVNLAAKTNTAINIVALVTELIEFKNFPPEG